MRYNGSTFLGSSIVSFDSSPAWDGYSRVVLIIDDTHEISVGSVYGTTLELEMPWGTREIAENILNIIRGFRYQPYTASKARINPAVDLGDAVDVRSVYSGVYSWSINFGNKMVADLSAPESEDIDHEIPFMSKADRATQRKFGSIESELLIASNRISAEVVDRTDDVERLKAALDIQAGSISAKVDADGGTSSFGWFLDDNSWSLSSANGTVLYADKYGLEVKGKIIAELGTIGGFEILSDCIRYNGQIFDPGNSNNNGVFIGPEGIQLGNAFSVDAWGHIIAESGEFRGTVQAGQILSGGNDGYFDGAGLAYGSVSSTEITPYTISTYNTDYGINTSLANADYAADALDGIEIIPQLSCDVFHTGSLVVDETDWIPRKITFKDENGANRTIWVLQGVRPA